MRGTEITKSAIRKAAETALERHVASWIIGMADDYGNGPAGVIRDLQYGGCSSGMVSHLIYTSDCVRFYEKHRQDIWALACERAENMGESNVFSMLANCNHLDPADYDSVANFLAWFGFEEAARTISDRVGYED
jgi:hypothetical protein